MPVKVPTANPNKPFVITYRDYNNAYKVDGSEEDAEVLYYPEPKSKFYKLLQYILGMIFVHYMFWFIPMIISVWLPYQWGYSFISLALLCMYIPTYFNGDELRYGRPWEWFRQHWAWRILQHFGKVEIVRECPLDPKRKYIFGFHPHGILILSRITHYGGVFEQLFPGIETRCLGATPMFNVPGSREVCLWMGAVRADKPTAQRILNTDRINILLFPGGSKEIFLTEPDSKINQIIARKGFIRLALQHGCDVVPSFVFGEKYCYRKLEIPEKIKAFFMRKLRTPLIIFWGKFYSWLPFNERELSIVYGKPIRVDRKEEPTEEEIDELYFRFYGEIRNLFEKYKLKYGYDESEELLIREAGTEKKGDSKGKIMILKNGGCVERIQQSEKTEKSR